MHFFAKIVTQLHISKLRKPHIPISFLLSLTSFMLSLVLFYSVVSIFVYIISGSSLDIGAYPIAFLFCVPFFGLLWAFIHILLLKIKEKGSRILLFAVSLLLIVPASFAAGFNYGAFDSVMLLEDSVIDLSSCTAWLHIKNNGLTDVQIAKIEIGDLICDVSIQYSFLWRMTLKRGETATLGIYYAHRRFLWGAILDMHTPYDAPVGFDLNLEITPTTFTKGKFPVVIHTDSIIPYRFEIEAKFLKPEEIYGVQAKIINLGQERVGEIDYCLPDIEFAFEMAPSSMAFIYSVDIGNLTIKLNPPMLIRGYQPYNDFALYFYTELDHISVYGPSTDAIPSQPITLPIFKIGETYNVTIRTMANNNYTTSLTMVQ